MVQRLKYKFETIKLLGNSSLTLALAISFWIWLQRQGKTKTKINEWQYMCVCRHTHTVKYYLATTTHNILPSTATWIDLKGITICKVSQGKINTVWYHLYVESNKHNQWVSTTKEQQTHRYRERTSGYQWGGNIGRGAGDTNYWT